MKELPTLQRVLLDSIRQTRGELRLFNRLIQTFPELRDDCLRVMTVLQTEITRDTLELIAAKRRWR